MIRSNQQTREREREYSAEWRNERSNEVPERMESISSSMSSYRKREDAVHLPFSLLIWSTTRPWSTRLWCNNTQNSNRFDSCVTKTHTHTYTHDTQDGQLLQHSSSWHLCYSYRFFAILFSLSPLQKIQRKQLKETAALEVFCFLS